jgi:alkaline phosphatase D
MIRKGAVQDFDPFREFVSGPLHAGTFGRNVLDNTFGPQAVYVKAPNAAQGQNLSSAMGMQFFGHVAIDSGTGQMKVTLKDVADANLWSTRLDPVQM